LNFEIAPASLRRTMLVIRHASVYRVLGAETPKTVP
jgi:hypothetical protein